MKKESPNHTQSNNSIKEKTEKRTKLVRSELNLEQNPIFTVSNYPGKSREIYSKKQLPTGETSESRIIIGKTADGIEVGVLTTSHFKVYLALAKIWEDTGRPTNKPIHFTILKILKAIGLSDTGPNYETIKRTLRNLVQIPITFENAFFRPSQNTKEGDFETIEDFHIISEMYIYERKKIGKRQKTRGYGEFQFSSPIIKSLIDNYSHPLRLDIIKGFKKHRDLSILLYTYIDRNLAFRNNFEIMLENLFSTLDLSQRHVKYPSGRKRVIEPVLGQLEGKELSTGLLSYCRVQKTTDGMDYKLVCRKSPFRRQVLEGDLLNQLERFEFGKSIFDYEQAKEPKSELLLKLTEKGLTPKQASKLVTDVVAENIIAQIDYLPFRVKEYKSLGREINQAAILYDSIKDNWKKPEGYTKVERKKENETKLHAIKDEYRERVGKAKMEAAKWAERSPVDRISAQLDSWIFGEERFNNHKPTKDELEAKKAELISYLPTQEEYEQNLIDEIERDIREKRQHLER